MNTQLYMTNLFA